MSQQPARAAAAVAVACLALFPADLPAQPAGTPNELDAFMQKVLARREVNRQTLEQYILDEVEEFEILGPGRMPLHRTRREFTWYVRDGVHVRSPLRFNGVSIGEEARNRYERNWLERERRRAEREAEKEREKKQEGKGEVSIGPDGVTVRGTSIPTEPRFVSEAYFMEFKFEPGSYYLAGREQLEGKDVLRIEYYPTRMFGDEKSGEQPAKEDTREGAPQQKREKDAEDQIDRRMNKTALITLWVDPSEHQIVKYTFDNVWLDFLPGAWLVRVDDLRASMTMGQPFPGVWLPRGMNVHAGITLANGSFEAGYSRGFSEYRQADVKSRIRIPKRTSTLDNAPERAPTLDNARERTSTFHVPGVAGVAGVPGVVGVDSVPGVQGADGVDGVSPSGPYVEEPQAQETIGEIRVHGNAYLTDDEVVRLAQIAVGQPIEPDAEKAVAKRLKDSGRFDTVEVRKRYRSLTSTTDVALVLVVHEKPGVRSSGGPDIRVSAPVFSPWRRFTSRLMFLPIVNYADGYGFTYGGRVSAVNLLGAGERLSVPLTWGGLRRAALEFERVFRTGPLTRINSSIAVWSRQNPRFEIRDTRVEFRARAERAFDLGASVFRLGVDGGRSTIGFAEVDDRLWTVGADATLDTRGDPAFPANAVFLSAGWTGMHFDALSGRVNRYTGDARGYVRLIRQSVVAGRALYTAADATLPPYERLLLGGSSTLRGFRTGAFDGDRTFATSAELRVPITSVLSGAKLGLTAFVDAAKVWDFGMSMDDVEWYRGAGAGVFLIAPLVRINLDVAHGLKTGDTRVHLSTGFTF